MLGSAYRCDRTSDEIFVCASSNMLMRVAVIAELMTPGDDLYTEFGVALQLCARHEQRCTHAMLPQQGSSSATPRGCGPSSKVSATTCRSVSTREISSPNA